MQSTRAPRRRCYFRLPGERDGFWQTYNQVVLAQFLSPSVPMRDVAARDVRPNEFRSRTVFTTAAIARAFERRGFQRVGEGAGGLVVLRRGPAL
jgi:hypothetical protein